MSSVAQISERESCKSLYSSITFKLPKYKSVGHECMFMLCIKMEQNLY